MVKRGMENMDVFFLTRNRTLQNTAAQRQQIVGVRVIHGTVSARNLVILRMQGFEFFHLMHPGGEHRFPVFPRGANQFQPLQGIPRK